MNLTLKKAQRGTKLSIRLVNQIFTGSSFGDWKPLLTEGQCTAAGSFDRLYHSFE